MPDPTRATQSTEETMSQHHPSRRHVVVIGRSPEKMRQALQVLESAGFAATGTFNREEAMAAITAHHRLFAVVAGGSVDREAEAEVRAAVEARGGQVVRANIGDSDPTQHFIDHVLPQLEKPRSRAAGEEIRAVIADTEALQSDADGIAGPPNN
jgi:hypothetical protein